MGTSMKGSMSRTEYFVILEVSTISMHRHVADYLDSVVGSQHKAFSLDSVHFSHCRRTQCQSYYAIGLKKKSMAPCLAGIN